MTNYRYALPFFFLGLAACSPIAPRPPEVPVAQPPEIVKPGTPHAAKPTDPVEQRPASPPSVKPSQPPKPAAPAPATAPAVIALMREAEASSASGSLDEAAATLERAIRIQPRNAQLWHKLAEIRLKQYQPGLAEDLAKKSNVLAKDDGELARQNWAIIADARRKKGDQQGAAEADAKARP
jgi:tetratricopeptide (TPR) repeat protein